MSLWLVVEPIGKIMQHFSYGTEESCTFGAAKTLYAGTQLGATEYLKASLKNPDMILGSSNFCDDFASGKYADLTKNIGGFGSHITAGSWSTNIVGEYGLISAGRYSKNIAGPHATISSWEYSENFGGDGCTLMGGTGSTLIFTYTDVHGNQQRKSYIVGKDGLMPNKPYEMNRVTGVPVVATTSKLIR